MRSLRIVGSFLLGLVLLSVSTVRAQWTPDSYANEQTLELLTVGPKEGEHWFKVWLVVLDGDIYVRLGSRAAKRIEANSTAPLVRVRIAGQEFARVLAEPAPQMATRVAEAMAEKYWSDLFVRHLDHPLTMRLRPAKAESDG